MLQVNIPIHPEHNLILTHHKLKQSYEETVAFYH